MSSIGWRRRRRSKRRIKEERCGENREKEKTGPGEQEEEE